MQFVDTVMAGHVSARDLAALGIATAPFHPLLLLMVGGLTAVTPMVAQLKGSQKDDRISKVVADALQLSLVFALPLILLLHLLEPLKQRVDRADFLVEQESTRPRHSRIGRTRRRGRARRRGVGHVATRRRNEGSGRPPAESTIRVV